MTHRRIGVTCTGRGVGMNQPDTQRITALCSAHHTSPASPKRITVRQSWTEGSSLKGFIAVGSGFRGLDRPCRCYEQSAGLTCAQGHVIAACGGLRAIGVHPMSGGRRCGCAFGLVEKRP
jgi:hypothetical protein